MPASQTITAFYSFTPSTAILSAQVNNNFNLFRGHLLPIDGSAASFANNSYDLGSASASWRNTYSNNLYLGASGTLNLLTSSTTSFTFPTSSGRLVATQEGTWTPASTFGGGNTGMTFSVQSGYYIKVGRMVTCWAWLQFTARGSSTGDWLITGLPFTSDSNTGYGYGGTINFSSWSSANGYLSGYVNPNATTALVLKNVTGAGSSSATNQGDVSNNSIFTFSFTYLAAS